MSGSSNRTLVRKGAALDPRQAPLQIESVRPISHSSLSNLSTMPAEPARSVEKSDAECRADVMACALKAWRRKSEAITLEELAAGTGMGFAQVSAQRDALMSAGMLEQVRVGTLGAVGYRPASHLRSAPNEAVAQKADRAVPSNGLRRLHAKIGYRPQ